MLGLSDDDQPRRLGRRIAPGLAIVLIAIVSIGLMMFDHAGSRLSMVRNTLSVVTQPVQMAAEWPQQAWHYLGRYFNRADLMRENDRLRRKNLLLEGRLQRLAALEAENERIRALLASASGLDQNVLIARILSVSQDPYRQYVQLNKGRIDGVFEGQALIDAHGIMGQITNVTPFSSRALLISDPNNGVPVEINRTGLQTIAQGTGHSEQLTLPFLPTNADVQVGDLLVSSGLGGRYPADYPVGRITAVDQRPGGEFLNVTAEPTAELDRGREVLLVWSTPADTESEPTASADAPDQTVDDADDGDAQNNAAENEMAGGASGGTASGR